uniref:Protein kintoun-like n=1 Tax=Rhipicephalus zambeziensis TaxID=60191 RepID=A0A224YP69_9ACAR
MTDVLSAPAPVLRNASSESSCDAIITTDCGSRLVFPDPNAGTPAIAMLLRSKCFFIRGPLHRTNGTERTEDEAGKEDIDCVSELRLQLNGLSISGAVFNLLEVHEARGSLDAEKRFPCANSLTGVYSIYRGASFACDHMYRSSLCAIPVERTPNLGRLEGLVVVTLPRLYANLSFGAAMEHWCGEPKILQASRLSIKPSHRHDCAVKKGAATSNALPRLLVRQSDGMLMLVFHTVATDPSTVSGSFCACKSAFQIVFSNYHSPEEVHTVAMATPFANDSLDDAFKVVNLQKTLFLFLYKTKSAFGTWKTFYVGTDFDNLQALELESPEAVRTSLTKRLSRQTQFSKCNSFESPENNKVEDKTNLVSKAPPVSRQQRSLSESSAYQIPQVSRRGILKNGTDWRRTTSESSDEFLSSLSLDSDTSLPASSLESVQPKKTVSFNDHISHIVYRANSSVLARRRRNQKKAANKKKAAARRALNRCDSTDTSGVSSGSEASLEDVSQSCQLCPSE